MQNIVYNYYYQNLNVIYPLIVFYFNDINCRELDHLYFQELA